MSAAAHTANLRERQKDTTREQIVATAMRLFREPGELSHERIAEMARMSARTVYRHFPSRDALIAATWEQLKAETETRFPQTEKEIAELAPRLFRNFDRHDKLVRAFLFSGAGTEVRERGAVEGRRAFQAALRDATASLPPRRRRQIVGVFLALYSAPAWQLMRDRGELSAEDAAQAVTWALTALLQGLHEEAQ
jgi:AcrR family transcriptional regulator